jgi:putative phosphonate metabolism protein
LPITVSDPVQVISIVFLHAAAANGPVGDQTAYLIVVDIGDDGNTGAPFLGCCSRVMRLYSTPMAIFPRYAVYYVAARGSDLDRFGAQILGYDAYHGEELPFPDGIMQVTPDWRDLTEDPRKYGFHATLKAPLSLAPGKTEAELIAACESFAGKPRSIPVIMPVVDSISGFIALVPAEPSPGLQRLAADCTREFDSYRAPLTSEDRARRNPAALTPRQRNYLDHWGYPYVMEEFRFHMTLTGRLAGERREPILKMLRKRFSTIGLKTLAIDRIALFRQENKDSRFGIVNYWKLRTDHGDRQGSGGAHRDR